MNFYNEIAHSYNKWVQNDSQAINLTKFYHNYLKNTDAQNIIYLGIATGRIALELTKDNSLNIIGVDNSPIMLEVCEKYFQKNNLQSRLTLLFQNILSLNIKKNNNIYILPFRTMLSFLSKEDKYTCLKAIYFTMAKGEVFIFDIDIFNESLAKENNGKIFLGYEDIDSGEQIYNEYNYDFKKQLVNIKVYRTTLAEKKLKNISKHNYNISWISNDDIKKIILKVGFTVKDSIFKNEHQIWILEK